MNQEVYYNIYMPGILQQKRQELAGKFILTEIERQYVSIEDYIDMFAAEAGDRLGEIYRYVIIGYSNGGNWNGLLTLYKCRLDHLLTDYINRLVESKRYAIDEIIEQMGTWIDTTTEVISGIIDNQKEDVLKKGTSKGTINPTTTKKRLEALDSIRDALFKMPRTSRPGSSTTSRKWTLPKSALIPSRNRHRLQSRRRKAAESLASPSPASSLTNPRPTPSLPNSRLASETRPATMPTSSWPLLSRPEFSHARHTMRSKKILGISVLRPATTS